MNYTYLLKHNNLMNRTIHINNIYLRLTSWKNPLRDNIGVRQTNNRCLGGQNDISGGTIENQGAKHKKMTSKNFRTIQSSTFSNEIKHMVPPPKFSALRYSAYRETKDLITCVIHLKMAMALIYIPLKNMKVIFVRYLYPLYKTLSKSILVIYPFEV